MGLLSFTRPAYASEHIQKLPHTHYKNFLALHDCLCIRWTTNSACYSTFKMTTAYDLIRRWAHSRGRFHEMADDFMLCKEGWEIIHSAKRRGNDPRDFTHCKWFLGKFFLFRMDKKRLLMNLGANFFWTETKPTFCTFSLRRWALLHIL
jgi:hypothetical protein